jgi:quercetin dioxygenase-like cupin family protein
MKNRNLTAALLCAGMVAMAASPAQAHGGRETVTKAFAQGIPNIPGKSLVAVVVDYPPGAASPPHLHAKSAFIYAHVLSGAVETQVNDWPTRIVRTGESFHEPPGARHVVSRKASSTHPARVLAVFVVDEGDLPLTTAIPESPNLGEMQ